jgi:hypothetical protein
MEYRVYHSLRALPARGRGGAAAGAHWSHGGNLFGDTYTLNISAVLIEFIRVPDLVVAQSDQKLL